MGKKQRKVDNDRMSKSEKAKNLRIYRISQVKIMFKRKMVKRMRVLDECENVQRKWEK